jgi:hypothetical protein
VLPVLQKGCWLLYAFGKNIALRPTLGISALTLKKWREGWILPKANRKNSDI